MVHVCMYMCVRETEREIAAFTFSILHELAFIQILSKDCLGWKGGGLFSSDSTHYMIPFDLSLHFFLPTKIFILSVICTRDSFPRYDIDGKSPLCLLHGSFW